MIVYKLRHKPSGLFFQPSRATGNLSLKGKIYPKKPSLDWVETIRINMWVSRKSKLSETIIKYFNPEVTDYGRINCYVKTDPNDWEIIEL